MSTPWLPNEPCLKPLQAAVHALESHHGWLDASPDRCCFLLGEEVGELFAAVRQWEHAPQDLERRAHVAEEIVDIMNYLLAIANRLDLDLDQAFHAKNQRNWTRTWPDTAS